MNSLKALSLLVALAFGAAGALAQSPKPPAPDLYALYCWADGYVKYAEDVKKAGIRWFRVGDFGAGGEKADRALLLASRNGAHFVPVLSVPGVSHGKTMDANEAVAKMREVARRNVLRYGPQGSFWKENKDADANSAVRYWEIWNEPNIEFLTPPDDPNGMLRTTFYAMLLKAASEEIRTLDPGACIIAFNTSGGAWDESRGVRPDSMYQKLKYIGWRKFIKDVVALTGPECFDAVGLHSYTQPRSPESGGVILGLEKLREVAKEGKFDSKPVWFTEVGFPVEYPRNLQVRDERQQACFTTRLFAVAAAHGVTQVQIMYIEDIVYSQDNTRRSFGFFTAPGKWREQATATRVMQRLIPDPRKDVGIISEIEKGVYAYRFQGAGNWPVLMAWTDGNGVAGVSVIGVRNNVAFIGGTRQGNEVVLQVASPGERKGDPVSFTAVDMLGNVSAWREADPAKVLLNEAPIYLIQAPKEEVEKLLKD